MAGGVRVVVNRREVRRLVRHPKVRRRLVADVAKIVATAQALAPKDTGGGAASIHAEGPDSQGAWRIGADQEHYYMDLQELGTVDFPPQPFLRPAADRYRKR